MDNREISDWKQLDLTAKYAQINTLRKLAADVSFIGISSQLNAMVETRIGRLSIDLIKLHNLDIPITS